MLYYLTNNISITFYYITKKLDTLFMIFAGFSVSTFYTLQMQKLLSPSSKPSYKKMPLIIRAFRFEDLCPVTTLVTYLEHRPPISGDPALFIKTLKPYKKASKNR